MNTISLRSAQSRPSPLLASAGQGLFLFSLRERDEAKAEAELLKKLLIGRAA